MERRKPLRLRQYDYGQPGAYFITVCTQGKKCLLGAVVKGSDSIAPSVKLSKVGLITEKYLRSIPGVDAYVIMPNHVHMILLISAGDLRQGPMWASAPTEGCISDRIRSWKTLITKGAGCGIWQRSFYDHVIRDERDYIRISQYIADNPAKWSEDVYYANC